MDDHVHDCQPHKAISLRHSGGKDQMTVSAYDGLNDITEARDTRGYHLHTKLLLLK